MTTAQITADVDRGLALIAQADLLAQELKSITERLEQAALEGEQVPLCDDIREGMRFLAQGTEATIPIIITADMVTQTFADGSPAHGRTEASAKGKLGEFYRRTITWKLTSKDGKSFRQEAAAILGDDAPSFISSCLARDKNGIPKYQIKIHWDKSLTP